MEAGERGPGGRAGSSADSLAEEEEEDEDEESAGSGRSSRTSSLVSGLLTELYSAAEAAAPSSASARSRVLQELQQRPSQVKYLRLKDVDELTTIKRELNYRISVQSSKLLCLLKQKDRLVHQVQKNCDIVTACLQAVSQKRCFSDENIYLQYNVTCHKALVHAFMYSINILISCNTKIFIKKKGAGFAVSFGHNSTEKFLWSVPLRNIRFKRWQELVLRAEQNLESSL